MKVQIGKWGNSLAMRLPKELVERYNLKEGDVVDAELIEPALADLQKFANEQRRNAALKKIREGRFSLPADWKFDRDEANWRPAMDRW